VAAVPVASGDWLPVVTRRPLLVWFLAGCGLVMAAQVGYVLTRGGDPTVMLGVGPDSPARPLLERELGPLALAPTLGHDGKYSYLVARRPWFWRADPEALAGLEDPAYRYGRPLYPLLAGLGGSLPPRATLAGLVAVQVLAGGLLAVVLAALARHNGLPTPAVLVGLANPGAYYSGFLLTGDLLALVVVLAGVLGWQRGRVVASLALFAAAVLAKESSALAPLALAGSLAADRRWPAALAVAAIPLLPLAAWRLALLAALGPGEGAGNFTWPGGGILAAAGGWRWDALPRAGLALGVVAAGLAAAVRASPPLLRWQCAAWGLLGLTASRLVWTDPADLLRVAAPLWWFAAWAWWPRAVSPTSPGPARTGAAGSCAAAAPAR
jgi:hypothetical protein